MFNLIITIIAIALVVVLTATSIYYGGSAFSNGSADALAATFVNQAQQVQAAATLFQAQNGGSATAITDLTTGNFLSSNPSTPSGTAWALDAASGVAFTFSGVGASNGAGTITAEVCDRINENGSNLVRCVEQTMATPLTGPTTGEVATAVAAPIVALSGTAANVVVYTNL